MKKLKIVSILILFSVLFALSGCVEKPSEEKTVLGEDGLVISFESGMPPISIEEKEPFDIGVLIENRGTAKVNKGDAAVFISGILYDSYSGIDSETAKESNSIDLEGAYIEEDKAIPGDSEVLQWIGLEYLPDITMGKYTVSLTAQSCYKYSTIARAPICLATRSAIRDTTGTAICEINSEKPVTNDGASVQVSKIIEYTYGSDGFRVAIEIQNVGDGAVYDNAEGTDCLGLHRQHLDRVYIDEIKLGGASFADDECTWITEEGKHYIKLQNGVKSFTCRKTGVAGAGISQENINIKLSYGYTESIQTSMDINAIV